MYYVKKYSGFSPRLKIIGQSLLASLGMSLFLFIIPRTYYQNNYLLLLIIALAILIYFGLLYFLKALVVKISKLYYQIQNNKHMLENKIQIIDETKII